MSAAETLARLGRARLVPVVVIDDAGCAGPLADALVSAGLPVAEVTFRTAAAEKAVAAMASRGDVLVGAGTIRTADQVDRAVGAGASYVVSPGLSRAVVERCHHHGVLALPGAVTATEIMAAAELGLGVVKFFPAGTSGGAQAVAALAAPFPDMGLVPTGGIGPAQLQAYLDLPPVVAVGGSWMVPRAAVAHDPDEVHRLTREAVALLPAPSTQE